LETCSLLTFYVSDVAFKQLLCLNTCSLLYGSDVAFCNYFVWIFIIRSKCREEADCSGGTRPPCPLLPAPMGPLRA